MPLSGNDDARKIVVKPCLCLLLLLLLGTHVFPSVRGYGEEKRRECERDGAEEARARAREICDYERTLVHGTHTYTRHVDGHGHMRIQASELKLHGMTL